MDPIEQKSYLESAMIGRQGEQRLAKQLHDYNANVFTGNGTNTGPAPNGLTPAPSPSGTGLGKQSSNGTPIHVKTTLYLDGRVIGQSTSSQSHRILSSQDKRQLAILTPDGGRQMETQRRDAAGLAAALPRGPVLCFGAGPGLFSSQGAKVESRCDIRNRRSDYLNIDCSCDSRYKS
jgi:hypothetical protein